MKPIVASVLVSGDGPAAYATALALRRLDIDVTILPRESLEASRPPVVLGESTVALIADLCGDSSVFASAHQLRKRIVCWGTDPPQAVSHAALSIRGTTLRRELFDTVAAKPDAANSDFHSWHVFSSAEDLPGKSTRLKIGERVTLACEVALAAGADSGTCWIESTQDGWAFLAPLSDRCALLQTTVPVPPRSAPSACSTRKRNELHIAMGQFCGNRGGTLHDGAFTQPPMRSSRLALCRRSRISSRPVMRRRNGPFIPKRIASGRRDPGCRRRAASRNGSHSFQ